jgi:hypothetical protein
MDRVTIRRPIRAAARGEEEEAVSFDVLGQLNWLAVIVAGIIYYALGAIWYAPPVLGRTWQKSIGWDPNTPAPGMSPMNIAIPLVGYIIAAAATGMLAAATGSVDVSGGIVLGLVIGVGYALTLMAVTAAFDPQKPAPWTWFAVAGGYHFVGLLIAAVVVSAWQ